MSFSVFHYYQMLVILQTQDGVRQERKYFWDQTNYTDAKFNNKSVWFLPSEYELVFWFEEKLDYLKKNETTVCSIKGRTIRMRS